MKKYYFFVATLSFLIFSCQNNDNKPDNIVTAELEKIEKINEKYSGVNFKETNVKVEQSFKASYDAEANKILSVNKNSERNKDVNYLINISEDFVVITEENGDILEEFKVLDKESNEDSNYFIEKPNDKYLFSHTIEKDGSYGYFEFRNSNSLRFYLSKKYN